MKKESEINFMSSAWRMANVAHQRPRATGVGYLTDRVIAGFAACAFFGMRLLLCLSARGDLYG